MQWLLGAVAAFYTAEGLYCKYDGVLQLRKYIKDTWHFCV